MFFLHLQKKEKKKRTEILATIKSTRDGSNYQLHGSLSFRKSPLSLYSYNAPSGTIDRRDSSNLDFIVKRSSVTVLKG